MAELSVGKEMDEAAFAEVWERVAPQFYLDGWVPSVKVIKNSGAHYWVVEVAQAMFLAGKEYGQRLRALAAPEAGE